MVLTVFGFSGAAPEVAPFHYYLEREQRKRSCLGDELVQHPSFPKADLRERLRDSLCEQHPADRPAGQSLRRFI